MIQVFVELQLNEDYNTKDSNFRQLNDATRQHFKQTATNTQMPRFSAAGVSFLEIFGACNISESVDCGNVVAMSAYNLPLPAEKQSRY